MANTSKIMTLLGKMDTDAETKINILLGQQEKQQHKIEDEYYSNIFMGSDRKTADAVRNYLFGPDNKYASSAAGDPDMKNKIKFINLFFGYTPRDAGTAFPKAFGLPTLKNTGLVGSIPTQKTDTGSAWNHAETYLLSCCMTTDGKTPGPKWDKSKSNMDENAFVRSKGVIDFDPDPGGDEGGSFYYTTPELGWQAVKGATDNQDILNQFYKANPLKASDEKNQGSSSSRLKATQSNIQGEITELDNIQEIRSALLEEAPQLYKDQYNLALAQEDNLTDKNITAGILSQEQKNIEQNRAAMEDLSVNKLRSAEINTYYAEQYRDQANLVKLLILIGICILFLMILNKQGIIPTGVNNVLLAIVIVVGCYFVGGKLYNYYRRDNMNYQEFDFGDKKIEKEDDGGSDDEDGSGTNLLQDLEDDLSCLGKNCCSKSTIFSEKLGKCVDRNGRKGDVISEYSSGAGHGGDNLHHVKTRKASGDEGFIAAYNSGKY